MKKIRDYIHMLVDMRNENKWSKAYDIIMLIAIFIGIFPLMFRSTNTLFWIFDLVSGICYIIDYIMRWSTADYKSKRKPWAAFLLYPFTPMAIIDLLSILPIVNLLSPTFKLARVSRLFKTMSVFKVIRYFEPLEIVMSVMRRQIVVLCTVFTLAVFYIFITALIMFNAEEQINPETGELLFATFFDAFYWSACTLTTVGYGDIYPISQIGRLISIISAMVGIAIIALPSGIITAGYMEEMRSRREAKNKKVNTDN